MDSVEAVLALDSEKRRQNIGHLEPRLLVEGAKASTSLAMTESRRTSDLSPGPKVFSLEVSCPSVVSLAVD